MDIYFMLYAGTHYFIAQIISGMAIGYLSVNPCFPLTLHSFNLEAPLYSLNTTRGSGLTLYIPCPSPRLSHFSK